MSATTAESRWDCEELPLSILPKNIFRKAPNPTRISIAMAVVIRCIRIIGGAKSGELQRKKLRSGSDNYAQEPRNGCKQTAKSRIMGSSTAVSNPFSGLLLEQNLEK